MRILKWVGIGLGGIVLVLALTAVLARNSDEPIAMFPGGPMTEGEWVREPVSDWSFATDVGVVHLQLLEPARTRTTWIVVRDGTAYIPCGRPNVRWLKQWPHQAVANGAAIVRVDGKRYPVSLVKDDDTDTLQAMGRIVAEKYGAPESSDPDEFWVFRLVSRPGSSG
jgi:hypothetical protein